MNNEQSITKHEDGSQIEIVGMNAEKTIVVAGKSIPLKFTVTEFFDKNFERPSVKKDADVGKLYMSYYDITDITVITEISIGNEVVLVEMQREPLEQRFFPAGGKSKLGEIKTALLNNFKKKDLYKNGIKKNKNQLYYTVVSSSDKILDLASTFNINIQGVWLQILYETLDVIDSDDSYGSEIIM